MPNLFSTFGRAALVALGLAVAPAAYAQLTCTNGLSPQVTGVGTATVQAVCGLTCTGGNVVSVDGQGNYSCVAGGGGNVAVSGCTLVQTSPIGSVPAGTDITFTGNCSSGTPGAITTLTWSKTGTGATLGTCASSATVGTPFTCVLTAGSGNGTISFSASNGVGSPASKSANFAVQAGGGGGGFASCPSGTRTSTGIYPRQYAPPGSSTDEVGSLPAGAYMSFKFTPTATSGSGGFFGSAIYGGNRFASWNVSTTACDFANPVSYLDSKGRTKLIAGSTSSNIDIGWTYGSQLQAGQTYYFNIKMNTCDSDNCHYDSLRFW